MCFFKALYSILHTFFLKNHFVFSYLVLSFLLLYLFVFNRVVCCSHEQNVIYHSHCCTCGGRSCIQLLKGNAFFVFAAAADQNPGTESGIEKMTVPVMSKDLINLDGNGGMNTHFNM